MVKKTEELGLQGGVKGGRTFQEGAAGLCRRGVCVCMDLAGQWVPVLVVGWGLRIGMEAERFLLPRKEEP